jgi:hypothetical protein
MDPTPARGLALSLLVLAQLIQSVPTAAAGEEAVAPLVIQGDATLCTSQERPSPIANCDSADGSMAHPYVLQNVVIDAGEPPNCPSNSDGAAIQSCAAPRYCAGSTVSAALSICNVTKYLVVRGVTVRNSVASLPGDSLLSARHLSAGIFLYNAPNASFENVAVEATGIGLRVEHGDTVDANQRPANRFNKLRVTTPDADPTKTSDVFAVTSGRETAEAPLFEAIGAGVVIENSTFDGSRRLTAVRSDGSVSQTPPLFHMSGSRVVNAFTRGVELIGVEPHITSTKFAFIGATGTSPYVNEDAVRSLASTGTSSAYPDIAAALWMARVGPAFEVVGNDFDTRGTAIRAGDSSNGTVEFNKFSGRASTDIAYFQRAACSTTFAFNRIETLRVVNAPGDCPLEARYNWWGNAGEPSTTPQQADGAMSISPWLRLPPEQLPGVVIASPPTGSEVRGNVVISGTAESKDGTPITKVQTSKTRFDWDDNATATGGDHWTLRLDASRLPPGPFSLWIRSCSAVDCGVPTRLDLAVAGIPTPPIAILRASTDIILVGEPVTLDGRNSYSPQGRHITGYSFDFGNENATPWGTDPTFVAVFEEPGTYTASLQVRDAAGLVNTNSPSVPIYVRAPSPATAEGSGLAAVPGPPIWETVLAGLLGITLVRGQRKNR